MRVTDKHVFFFSWKDMFSNHHRSKVPFFLPRHERQGVRFFTGENFMMYEKAMLFGDTEKAQEICAAFKPQRAKELGRQVAGFDNAVWELRREGVMFNLVYCRLVYDLEVRREALTHRLAGRDFVEASPWDKIWGVGLKEDDPKIDDPINWRGLNLLGKAWNDATDSIAVKFGGYDQIRKDFA